MSIRFPADAWPRLSTLFDEALSLHGPARDAWLADLARDEPALSPHLMRLLAAHASRDTADWLSRGPAWSADEVAAGTSTSLQPGQVVGAYRLLEHVASGGMGQVWRAQALRLPQPRVVALKLPLLHRADSAAAARFAREGAILAGLEHPHIARLYDAGTADDGTPYLALAWVQGRPLLAWCREQGLGSQARIAVFLQVLDAVAYAHARLVLHRDLKPSNLMVDEHGQAQLLDFGIAKLLGDDARSDATELTLAAGRVMTTAYAAPEQLRGQTLTPATDVYALGVLLFELLTGQRPYRVPFDSPAQLEAAIVQGDLRRPGELVRGLRGDIDAIVACATRRDPAQRYAGAAAFADDLRRHLEGRPVLARPDGALYVLGRFVRRHRAVSLAVAVGTASLAVGIVAAVMQARQAEHERDRAVAATRRAQSTQRFLADLLNDAARAGKPLTVPELMERAETMGRRTLRDRPDELAAVLNIVAGDAVESNQQARARELLEEALRLSRDPDLTAELGCNAAQYAGMAGQTEAARARLRRFIADETVDADVRTHCRLSLAQLLIQNGDLAEADELVEQAWAHVGQRRDAWRERTWAVTMQVYLRSGGRAAGLDARAQSTIELLRDMGREQGRLAMGLYNTWGTLAMTSGEPAKAAERYGYVVQRLHDDDPRHDVPPYHLNMLATALTARGALDEAAAALDRSLAAAGPDNAARYNTLCLRGRVAALQGRAADSDALYRQADAVPDAGEPLRRNARPFCDLSRAEALVQAGRAAEAHGLLVPLLAAQPRLSVELSARLVLAEAELALGRAPSARDAAQRAEALARRLQADNRHSARTGQALALQALASDALGDAATALRLAREALEHLQATTLPQERWQRRMAQRVAGG